MTGGSLGSQPKKLQTDQSNKANQTAENKYICTYLAYSNSDFFLPSLSFRAQ